MTACVAQDLPVSCVLAALCAANGDVPKAAQRLRKPPQGPKKKRLNRRRRRQARAAKALVVPAGWAADTMARAAVLLHQPVLVGVRAEDVRALDGGDPPWRCVLLGGGGR